ncbi:nodulation protein NodN [Labrenzia sp. CP4]|nr:MULTISPECIES: MaoC family dehydratase [unclassified Labrenzia]AMN56306.1 nodulation protein NodN [Labrenzia sp. CP4]MBO9460616.1 MaoC family dehydratase [Labrenzia sp. R5_0]NKI59482.1 MaoC family dehydratase [Labrenzia sp. PO1]
MSRTLAASELETLVGTEVGVSSWYLIDQARIDAFAEVTQDHQFIHVDPERAAETPFEGTIAHGFLTLSLLSAMGVEAQPKIKGATMGINYGFDKVRFLAPVKVGSRVRGRFVLARLSRPKPQEVDIVWQSTVEIENGKRPALVAEWLNRFYLEEEADKSC